MHRYYMLHQADTADAEDVYKIMLLKDSSDKVIEADLLYTSRCFTYAM